MRILYFSCLFFILSVFLNSCKKQDAADSKDALFQLLPASQTGITFNNKVVDDGEFNVFNYRNFYNGGGVAIGDVNNDGKPDIFFTSNQGDCKLYLNKGNWKFEDVTAKSGLNKYKRWHAFMATLTKGRPFIMRCINITPIIYTNRLYCLSKCTLMINFRFRTLQRLRSRSIFLVSFKKQNIFW